MRKTLIFLAFILSINGNIVKASNLNEGTSLYDIQMPDSIVSQRDLVNAGIPSYAIPASAYFKTDTVFVSHSTWSNEDIGESCLSSDDQFFTTYCFFVVPTIKREDIHPLVDIWMYDADSHKATKVYCQTYGEDSITSIVGMHWGYNIISKDSSFTNPISNERYKLIHKTAQPILILETLEESGTVHAPSSTIVLNPRTGHQTWLKGQRFVSLLKTDDRALAAAEIGLSQTYIITTDTEYKFKTEESRELTESETDKIINEDLDRIDFVDHCSLSPFVNIFSLDGILVSRIQLPTELTDIIR